MPYGSGRYDREIEDDYERRHYPERYAERMRKQARERTEAEAALKRQSEFWDDFERRHSGGGQGVYS
ncbi:MAG: hypothetical protein EOO77_29740 [Oxalobacteraceae bacterium]|nr:MAG: hypothetical protein EOO77_29740 [Oxalobacteraceae bacterium]